MGPRMDGAVRVCEVPVGHGGRAFRVEERLESRAALDGLVDEYVRYAPMHGWFLSDPYRPAAAARWMASREGRASSTASRAAASASAWSSSTTANAGHSEWKNGAGEPPGRWLRPSARITSTYASRHAIHAVGTTRCRLLLGELERLGLQGREGHGAVGDTVLLLSLDEGSPEVVA